MSSTTLIPLKGPSITAYTGYIKYLITESLKSKKVETDTIICPEITRLQVELACLKQSVNQMFDISGCVVTGLTDEFKCMICDAVNNYYPYYCPTRGLGLNATNFDSSDNSNTFFREEIISNDDTYLRDTDFSIMETSEQDNNANFIAGNLTFDNIHIKKKIF